MLSTAVNYSCLCPYVIQASGREVILHFLCFDIGNNYIESGISLRMLEPLWYSLRYCGRMVLETLNMRVEYDALKTCNCVVLLLRLNIIYSDRY